MNIEDMYIGMLVEWNATVTNYGTLCGHVSGLALNSVGEVIVKVIPSEYSTIGNNIWHKPGPRYLHPSKLKPLKSKFIDTNRNYII